MNDNRTYYIFREVVLAIRDALSLGLFFCAIGIWAIALM